jgi:hypothetical protein
MRLVKLVLGLRRWEMGEMDRGLVVGIVVIY